MFRILALLSAVAILFLGFCKAEYEIAHLKSLDQYIMGGEVAARNEFPWQLSLQYRHVSGQYRHTCGASLYKTKYALTAAHCVKGREKDTLRVVAGLHRLSDLSSATIIPVKHFKIHEKYKDQTSTSANDMAVLTLAFEVKPTSTIKPASIPKDNVDKFVNKTCIISGWGRNTAGPALADTLRKGKVDILSNRHCQNLLPTGKVGVGNVCIYDSKKNTGACNGDSGGPINCKVDGKDMVIGASSWIVTLGNVCQPKYPSAYARISEYLTWIAKNTP